MQSIADYIHDYSISVYQCGSYVGRTLLQCGVYAAPYEEDEWAYILDTSLCDWIAATRTDNRTCTVGSSGHSSRDMMQLQQQIRIVVFPCATADKVRVPLRHDAVVIRSIL